MATHSSTLAWKIPWTAEPGWLLSMWSHRVGHDWSNLAAAAATASQAKPTLLIYRSHLEQERSRARWAKCFYKGHKVHFQVLWAPQSLQPLSSAGGAQMRPQTNVSEWVWSESHSVVSDSLWPHGLYSPWNSPGQNTGVGSLSLLQEIFPTQGLNPGLLHCRQILYQLSHKRSPRILEWVAYLFSRSSRPRNQTWVS